MKTIGEYFNYTIKVPAGWLKLDSLRFSQTKRQEELSREAARQEYLARYSLNLSAN